MTDVNHGGGTVPNTDLNSIDRWILDYLSEHEWATPNLMLKFYNDDRDEDEKVGRQWISQRIGMLTKLGYLRRVHPDAYTYELVVDPRQTDSLYTEETQ